MTDKTDKDKCVLTIFHHFAHLAHGHCLQASDSDFEDRVTLFGAWQGQWQWQWQRQRLRYMGTVHWALWASNNSLTQFGAPAPEWVILAGWKGTQGQMPSYMRTDLECLWELYQPDRMKLLVAGLFWKGDLEHLLKPKAAPNHFWLLLPFRLHIAHTTVHNGASQNWPEYSKEANFYACRHHVGIM